MAFATGKVWWDSGLLLMHRSVRFLLWHKDLCLRGCPRQEASKYLRYRSGQWPRCVTPWDLYKQQWDPEPGGTKLKAQSRDQKWGKGLLWTVALPERASVGEGTKPRITKLMKAIWVEPNNKVIIQIFLFLCCCLQMRIKTTIEVANRDGQSL